MAGLFTEAYEIVVDALAAADLPVIDDPRNLRPPGVIVDPPTFTAISANLVEFDFPVSIIMPPPGNKDALYAALTLIDDILLLPDLLVISGTSGVYTTGGQELPSYQLIIKITVRREP
jgi:hypothetical protein